MKKENIIFALNRAEHKIGDVFNTYASSSHIIANESLAREKVKEICESHGDVYLIKLRLIEDVDFDGTYSFVKGDVINVEYFKKDL